MRGAFVFPVCYQHLQAEMLVCVSERGGCFGILYFEHVVQQRKLGLSELSLVVSQRRRRRANVNRCPMFGGRLPVGLVGRWSCVHRGAFSVLSSRQAFCADMGTPHCNGVG